MARAAARGLLLAAALVAGCGGDGGGSTPPGPRPVAQVAVSGSTTSIVVGGTATFTATARDASGVVVTGRTTAWSTGDATVASVSAAGVVTGIGPGTTTIAATIDGIAGSAPITITLAPVASVSVLSLGPGQLFVGETSQLSAVARDAAGNPLLGRATTWSTSDASVATVSATGLVSAAATGTATIRATVEGIVGSLAVAVVPRTVATVTVRPSPGLVGVGGTASLAATGLDAHGGVVAGTTFRYQSSDSTIATVTSAGLVAGQRAGTATITAAGGGSVGATAVTVVQPTTLQGRAVVAGGLPVSAMQAVVRTGTGTGVQSWTAPLDASAAFRLPVPLTFAGADSADVILDASSGSRAFHPVLVRAPDASVQQLAAKPLLVPENGTINSPTYPATTVSVSLQKAFTRVCTDDSNANCNSFFPQLWKTSVVLWSEADLPVPLAFNRGLSAVPITDADSASVWDIIHKMETDLGRQLFKPVDFASLPAPNTSGYSNKAVLLWVDGSVAPFAGYTNWIWDVNQNMVAAKLRVASAQVWQNPNVLTHELLHALGFHHTCQWGTVMGGYGCGVAVGVTRADAVGFQLAYEIRRAILASTPTTTLADALRGEQALEAPALSLAPPAAATAVRFAPLGPFRVLMDGRIVWGDGAP